MSASDITSGDKKDSNTSMETLCKQLFRKEIIHPPSNYTRGDDVKVHIQKIEEYFNLADINSSDDKVNVFMNTLDSDLQKEMKMTKGYKETAKDFKKVVELFVKMFKGKSAAITPFLKMLQIKQTATQSIEDFSRELRIRAFDLIYECSEEKREEMMLKCFINGLKNKNLSIALDFYSPKTLDEAVKLVKKEDQNLTVTESAEVITCSQNCHTKILELQKNVRQLQEQISKIGINNDQSRPRTTQWRPRTYAEATKRYTRQNYSRTFNRAPNERKCFNCNQAGHLAMNCQIPRKCYNCGKIGHISRFCRMDLNRQSVNFVGEKTDSFDRNKDNSSSARTSSVSDPPPLCVSNRYDLLSDEGENFEIPDDNEEVYMFHNFERPKTCKPRPPSACSEVEKFVNAQVAFIEGKGKNPIRVSTVPGVTANKPIVRIRLNGKQAMALMDSGATCNLINKSVVDKIGYRNAVKVTPNNSHVACANNSSMQTHGETILAFSLGGTTVPMKFIIVSDLQNVDCIVGLRAMKKLGVTFDFGQDNLILNKIVIPFESVVFPSTTIPELGNESELNL